MWFGENVEIDTIQAFGQLQIHIKSLNQPPSRYLSNIQIKAFNMKMKTIKQRVLFIWKLYRSFIWLFDGDNVFIFPSLFDVFVHANGQCVKIK